MLFNSCKKEQHKDPTDPTYISSVYFGDDIAVHSVKEGFTLLKVSSYQQTTEYTCGPAAVLSMMKFYNRTGDEMSIAGEMGTSTTTGTTPGQVTDWLNTHGFHATWQEHGTLEMLRENLAKNKPTLVEWSDWGGHWVLVIGYDTRNTEDLMDDVIIFADPYDRHDDHKDGVTWFNAQRFYYMWYDALLFGSVMRNVYIQAEPI
jgi:hypothetical protein